MTFLEDDGTEIKVEAQLGATLLEVAHENDVELEGEFCTSYVPAARCTPFTLKIFTPSVLEVAQENGVGLNW